MSFTKATDSHCSNIHDLLLSPIINQRQIKSNKITTKCHTHI